VFFLIIIAGEIDLALQIFNLGIDGMDNRTVAEQNILGDYVYKLIYETLDIHGSPSAETLCRFIRSYWTFWAGAVVNQFLAVLALGNFIARSTATAKHPGSATRAWGKVVAELELAVYFDEIVDAILDGLNELLETIVEVPAMIARFGMLAL
jgi:hypothetical protein